MSLLKALSDPAYWEEVANQGRNFGQATSNAVAQVAAAPVDLINMGLGFAGLSSKRPVGGTEWLKEIGLYRDVPQGAAQVAGETLGNVLPVAIPAKASQIAGGLLKAIENASRPATMGSQRGMLYSPLGRIPETAAERKQMQDLLERYGEKAGYRVETGRAGTGASQYVTFTNPLDDTQATIRLSDHAPSQKYVPSHPFVSVDTGSPGLYNGGTFEEAISWLSKNGFNLPRLTAQSESKIVFGNAQKQAAIEAELAHARSMQQAIDAKRKAQASNSGFVLEKTRNGYRAISDDGREKIMRRSAIPENLKTGDRKSLFDYIMQQ